MAYKHIPFAQFVKENMDADPEAAQAVRVLKDALRHNMHNRPSDYVLILAEGDPVHLNELVAGQGEVEALFILYAVHKDDVGTYEEALEDGRRDLPEIVKGMSNRMYVYNADATIEYSAGDWTDSNIADSGKPASMLPNPPEYDREFDYTVYAYSDAGYIEYDGQRYFDTTEMYTEIDDEAADLLADYFVRNLIVQE